MTRGVALSADTRKIIIKKFHSGNSSYKIAESLHLPRSTVQNIITFFKKKW